MPDRESCRRVLAEYRERVAVGAPSNALTERARGAYRDLGGDPEPSSLSLKDYDSNCWGPFLGVSDEGSAAGAIRDAALTSPKVRALPKSIAPGPLVVGVAVDAERLGGIGEVMVGPDEYADIWLAAVDRILVTTNISTRVNTRVYRREPRIILKSDSPAQLVTAKEQIAAAFRPFVETPDKKPRPLTVFVDIPRYVRMSTPRKRKALKELAQFVKSGQAAGQPTAPRGHVLGLVSWVGRGLNGRDESMRAIDLASSAGLGIVVLDGVKRKAADEAISLAGLLDYFEPGIVGPLLRRALQKKVRLRVANLPDTDTIARSVWSGLATARNMGANLGKYGCFPLTQSEIARVVKQVQEWFPNWSAAPVFFVDQGLLRETAVDVNRDLPRGIEAWLDTVASCGVKVVLIDTIDKPSGRRLLKKAANDKTGFLSLRQISRIEECAHALNIKVLWAGGFGMRDVFELGKLGVFGVYVTSAAATTVPVTGSYANEPVLPGLKEPTEEAVLRTKIILEAGFLSGRVAQQAANLGQAVGKVITALEGGDQARVKEELAVLSAECEKGWRAHWAANRGCTSAAPAVS